MSETCDEYLPHLITNVHTTPATAQDVACTADIQNALYLRNLLPSRHLVDAGYIDAALLVQSADKYDIELFGPTRNNPSWQTRAGGFDSTQFQIDWQSRQAVCPAGKAVSNGSTVKLEDDITAMWSELNSVVRIA